MARRRALLSVSDKTGAAAFAKALTEMGWEVLSTGGTARALEEAGVPVTEVGQATGHPEMMEGRVKTLHPAVHAGILARRSRPDDIEELARQGYQPVDLVAVNLYPFRQTVADPGATHERAMENVDIGGPAMIRAAAKNHRDVWAVVDPADYGEVLQALADGDGGGPAAAALRRRLAAKVFREIASYDAAVADYMSDAGSAGAPQSPGTHQIDLALQRRATLRYGENPDQAAAFYVPAGSAPTGLAALVQLQGKELSYNNLLDLDGALLALAPFAFAREPAVCVVKHTAPCGLALRPTLAQAFARARDTDPVSAFGSVIATNRAVDRETAAAVSGIFVECVVAPAFSPEARDVLAAKKNLRLLEFPDRAETGDPRSHERHSGDPQADAPHADAPHSDDSRSDAPHSGDPHPDEPADAEWWLEAGEPARAAARFLARAGSGAAPGLPTIRSVYGGALAQSAMAPPFHGPSPRWKVVTRRSPTRREARDLSFAWAAVASVKSNAVLLAKNCATVGIGGGQTSRVDSSRIAVAKAREAGLDAELRGAAMASDAFFPFRDGVDAAAAAGVRAIVQPGGSVRDREVVEAADEHGIAMVFTGRRLFRH